MYIIELLKDKSKKPLQKRVEIEEVIKGGFLSIDDLTVIRDSLDEKSAGLLLEAMEAVTNNNPSVADIKLLNFVEPFIISKNNTAKREASRIVGNIAHLVPNELDTVIQKLITNTEDGGTVIRWSSAYALARIILVPQYTNSDLYDFMTLMYDNEKDNGVKNQYLGGLKKARKLRK
jgi:hypothetical protein